MNGGMIFFWKDRALGCTGPDQKCIFYFTSQNERKTKKEELIQFISTNVKKTTCIIVRFSFFTIIIMLSACGNTILQTKHCHNQGQKFQRRKPTCREVSSGGVQIVLNVSKFLLVHAADTIRRCGPLSKLFVQPTARGPFPALFQV